MMCQGGQNDVLRGGTGDDVLKGGSGDDKLIRRKRRRCIERRIRRMTVLGGGQGDDMLKGGSGDDKLYRRSRRQRIESDREMTNAWRSPAMMCSGRIGTTSCRRKETMY